MPARRRRRRQQVSVKLDEITSTPVLFITFGSWRTGRESQEMVRKEETAAGKEQPSDEVSG